MVRISGRRDPEYLARKRAREEAQRGQPKARFANAETLDGIVEYSAFEFPRGSGITWRVDPLSWRVGRRITEIELEMAALREEAERLRDDNANRAEAGEAAVADLPRIGRFAEQYATTIEKGAAIAGPLMIPTGKWRWRYKLLRRLGLLRFWRNPLRDAQSQDVAWVVGFLARCQMSSPSRARHLADVSRN